MKNSAYIKDKTAGRYKTIALLGTSLYYDIPINIFRAIRDLSKKYNFNLHYFSELAYQSPYSFNSPANILYQLIKSQITEGIIVISNPLCSLASPQVLHEVCLRFHPLPIVSLGMAIKGIPSVIPDNAAGMYDAVSHLIEVHHYSRIAFLSGPLQHPDAMERFTGFTRAMETHHLPVDESLLVEGTFEMKSGIAGVTELLDNRSKSPGKDIQAIVCCNDYIASGVIVELQRRGIRIPDQLAITGFDDINLAGCLIPPLSTVLYPYKALTAKAIEILKKLIAGKTVAEVVTLHSEYIPRRTCGCPDSPGHIDTQSWTEDLKKQFNNNFFKFPESLNRQSLMIDRPVLNAWKPALTRLRLKGTSDQLSSHENHFIQASDDARQNDDNYSLNQDPTAWEFLGKTAYRTFNNINYQTVIHHIENTLSSAMDLSELINILSMLLPEAEISRCCLCLYENQGEYLNKTTIEQGQNVKCFPASLPPWSRLVLSFTQTDPVKLPPDGIRFNTKEFLPEEIIRKLGPQSWIILPLYFKQEQFGYILLDSDVAHEYFYGSICSRISSTLMGIRQLEECRKTNEQKTQFFINIAHETKTPLTLIKNYLSLYIERHQPDEYLELIGQNIDLLLKNMLNFLDVETLQKGNDIYNHDTLVDLSESARKKCELFRGVAEMKDISIKMNIEDNVFIKIDTFALDRIFNNLLDNAVKYIQSEGRIMVDVRRGDGKAILRISDNGPGLPVETFDHIFEPYYLLSQKKTSKQGIGVGLSIVKKIIDGLNAGINVEKFRGGGVSFSISFTDESIGQPMELQNTITDTAPSYLVNAIIKEKNISAEKPSLLIVDDNVQLLQFMQTALEKKYNVYLAEDVSEALFKLMTIPHPSLIIADIMMDGVDGFMLLEKISEMESCCDIPFIFLTAMSGEKQRIKGLDLGAVDYIEKPFSISELCAKIDSHIVLRKRQEKQNTEFIKNKIRMLFSDLEQNIAAPKIQGFDAVCQKYGINEREMEIIRMLLKGLLYKEIAANLNISLRTVEYSISNIYKKCNVSNKSELIRKFLS